MQINPVWEPVTAQAVNFLAEPISGHAGDFTYGTVAVVLILILAAYVGTGGKL